MDNLSPNFVARVDRDYKQIEHNIDNLRHRKGPTLFKLVL